MTAQYGAAYAKYAPIMRDKWRDKSAAECAYAKADILNTLPYYDHESSGYPDPAYAAKLYAELDAIRDREMAINKGVKQ